MHGRHVQPRNLRRQQVFGRRLFRAVEQFFTIHNLKYTFGVRAVAKKYAIAFGARRDGAVQ